MVMKVNIDIIRAVRNLLLGVVCLAVVWYVFGWMLALGMYVFACVLGMIYIKYFP